MAKNAKRAESKPKKSLAKPSKAKPAPSKPVAGKLARAAVSKPAKSAKAAAGASDEKPTAKGTNSQGKAHASPAAPKYATLDEARSATIDALLSAIEDAEHRLSAAKRADSIDELVKLGQGLG